MAKQARAKQARILDFEEARSSSYRRSSQRKAVGDSSLPDSGSRTASRGSSKAGTGAAKAGSKRNSASLGGKRASGRKSGSLKSSGRNSGSLKASGRNSASLKSGGRNSRDLDGSSRAGGSSASSGKGSRASGRNSASLKANGRNSGSLKASGRNSADLKAGGRGAQGGKNAKRTAKVSTFDQVKREALKKKAERSYSRNVKESAPEQDGPRAALYKGKMGAVHKKALAMQDGLQGRLAALSLPFNLPKINLSRKKTIALLVCACLVVTLAMLYVPVKTYYFAIRDQAKAEVAYEIVATRNEALQKDVALLTSETGMEDRAREQYGWVKQGDNSVTVTGLGEDGEPSAADVLRTVTLNDLRAPETWYSPFLDSVFGYTP